MKLTLLPLALVLAPALPAQTCDAQGHVLPGVHYSSRAGTGLSASRDVVFAIGNLALEEQGPIFVFERAPGTFDWSLVQQLGVIPGQSEIGDGIAHDGDVMVTALNDPGVGAWVNFFERDAQTGQWALAQTEAPLVTPGVFGRALAVRGDTCAIAAAGDEVLVYRRDPGTGAWSEEQRLTGSNNAPGDYFGLSLAMGDGVIAVCSTQLAPLFSSGSVYVYRHDAGSGSWVEEQQLLPANPVANDYFGWGLGIEGDHLAIGRPGIFSDPDSKVTTYDYDLAAGTWSLAQEITAGESMGRRIALEGDFMAVQASLRVHLHGRAGAGSPWALLDTLDPLPGQLTFADGLALEGGTLAIGTGYDPGDVRPLALFRICADVGASYCGPGVPSSSGAPAAIAARGGAPVPALLELTGSGLPPMQTALFITSTMQGFVAGPGTSQGNLCLGGSILRLNGTPGVLQSDATGAVRLLVEPDDVPSSPPLAILPGETWNFQLWFRDLNPGQTSNFSDGVEVLFR